MSDSSSNEEQDTEVLFIAPEEVSSGEEPPMSEWSSLVFGNIQEAENVKKTLFGRGLYSPGSGDVCPKYITQSDSAILRHPYYNYPAVLDPGIKEALLAPEAPIIFPDDGQALYLHLCSELNLCPIRMFHKNLLNPEICLSYYGVDPRAVYPISMALQFNKHVKVFNLTDNFLNDDGCYHLGQMLKTNTTMSDLILTGCRIGKSGLLCLGHNLNMNQTLTTLNLAKNKMDDAGGVHFAKLVTDGIHVKNVNLSYNNLGRETALALGEVFEWRNNFTHLDLSWNNFYHMPSMAKMLEKLATGTNLKELNLSFNALEGERVGHAISDILLMPALQVLNLSNNRLQSETVDLIASSLINAKKLVTLNLSFNPLSPADAYNTLEKMLKPRVKLQNLLLENIDVDTSFLKLLERVKRMKSRKKFVTVFGIVLQNWNVSGPDTRELILKRADYLGKSNKRNKIDIGLYFLGLAKVVTRPMLVKDLLDQLSADSVPLTESVVEQFSIIFPGPKAKKLRTIDLNLVCEYIQRIWPDRKLPPTPPPEPEPEPEPEPIAPEPQVTTKQKKKK